MTLGRAYGKELGRQYAEYECVRARIQVGGRLVVTCGAVKVGLYLFYGEVCSLVQS